MKVIYEENYKETSSTLKNINLSTPFLCVFASFR